MSDSSRNRESAIAISLTAKDGAAALEFYRRAFGAEVVERYDGLAGTLPHAELKIGNTHFYLSDESSEWHAVALPPGMMAPCLFAIRTDDSLRSYRRALECGAKSLGDPQTTDLDPLALVILDPFGYRWTFHQRERAAK